MGALLGTVLGRLIVTLIDAGVIDEKRAAWILQPLKDKAESEGWDKLC